MVRPRSDKVCGLMFRTEVPQRQAGHEFGALSIGSNQLVTFLVNVVAHGDGIGEGRDVCNLRCIEEVSLRLDASFTGIAARCGPRRVGSRQLNDF